MSRPAPIRKPYIRQVRATRPSVKMTNNPGPFVNLPWYKFTFEKELITQGDNQDVPVTIGNILDQIRTRLQHDANATIRIKVQQAKIWITAGSGLAIPQVVGSFYNTTNDSNTKYPRAQMNDSGTLNMPAKLSYKYPVSDRMVILDGQQQANNIVNARVNKTNSLATLRVDVLFQTGNIN